MTERKPPPPTPHASYSLRPSWLTDSLKTLESFKKTSEAVQLEFSHLNKAFDDFDVASAKAAASDLQHQQNLASNGYSTTETSAHRKQKLIAASKRHPFVCLPTEIHGRIVCYLDLFGVDRVLCLSNVVRCALGGDFPEVWKPWATERWAINEAEGGKTCWLAACHTRASVLRPIVVLCDEYRHRDTASYKTAGAGNLKAWSELLSGLVYLTSAADDWMSRRMIRQNGGARFLMGLSMHDSHNIRTLALASIANVLATTNAREQERWIRNLAGCRAAKIFSSIMISPLKDVTSNTSREAARALVNLAIPHAASISREDEVLSRSCAHIQEQCTNHTRGGYGGLRSRWEQDGNWKLDLTFQSGGICASHFQNVVLQFQANGLLTGSMFDYSEQGDRGEGRNGQILFVMGWYHFNQHRVGVGQLSFTIYKTEEEAALAVPGLLSSSNLDSNNSLGGVGGLRNFTGYSTSGSRGFFGIWENSGGGKTMKLNGGGGFRLRWKRNNAVGAGQKAVVGRVSSSP